VGFSWGGLSNVLAAAKDARIKALVDLEGSVRYFPELVDGGKDAAKYVTPARVAVPMLYLGRRPPTIESLSRDTADTRYSFLNEMKYSDVYIVSLMPLEHRDFTSYNLRVVPDEVFKDYSREEVVQAYSWAALYTQHFLDAYLKNDATALAFMNNAPAANKAPTHMLAVDIRRSKTRPPPSQEDFVTKLAAEGFDKAVTLYDELVAQGTGFKLGLNDIIGWTQYLEQENRLVQAREICRLGTHLAPKSLGAWFELAKMQLQTGQPDEAARTYRQILAIEPDNAVAKKSLSEMRPAASAAAN
jgi:tetratricopeptide (TPR) repeat protein